jgi:hypothetical protein
MRVLDRHALHGLCTVRSVSSGASFRRIEVRGLHFTTPSVPTAAHQFRAQTLLVPHARHAALLCIDPAVLDRNSFSSLVYCRMSPVARIQADNPPHPDIEAIAPLSVCHSIPQR